MEMRIQQLQRHIDKFSELREEMVCSPRFKDPNSSARGVFEWATSLIENWKQLMREEMAK